MLPQNCRSESEIFAHQFFQKGTDFDEGRMSTEPKEVSLIIRNMQFLKIRACPEVSLHIQTSWNFF